MRGIIQQNGIPLALYSDRHLVFHPPKKIDENEKSAGFADGKSLTQFGRAMKELGVTHIFARSPEAKGRIERANGTFQDRLVSELRLAGVCTIEEANRFLQEFVPRYNEHFRVPAAQPELAYRPLESGLDLDGVLCFKERRRVAKDNTVQYNGQTLQIFPGLERTSYARAHVEVQERLDGRLLVCYKGKILTPTEAPPLAASLRARANSKPGDDATLSTLYPESGDIESSDVITEPKHRVIWYADPEMKLLHRDLVKAGMERARQQGKRIGRPRVSERPEFTPRLASVMERLHSGELSRRQAAKELNIGYATLTRLMDKQIQILSPLPV